MTISVGIGVVLGSPASITRVPDLVLYSSNGEFSGSATYNGVASTIATTGLSTTGSARGTLPIHAESAALLTALDFNTSHLVGSIPSLQAFTALASLDFSSNAFSGLASNFAVPETLLTANFADNALSEALVDGILLAFVTAGGVNGDLNLLGTNASPSVTGDGYVTTLRARGWNVAVPVIYEDETTALVAAFSTPPTGVRKYVINTAIAALKSASLWTKIDRMWVMAAADSQAGRVCWNDPTKLLTEVSSPTFVADRGYTSAGAGSWLTTGFVPSTDAVNFTQNSAGLHLWSLTDSSSDYSDIGNTSGNRALMLVRSSGNANISRLNHINYTAFANASGLGLFSSVRTASNIFKIFRNGAQIGNTLAEASTGLPSEAPFICGAAPSTYSIRQQAMAAWTGGMSDAEVANFYGIMHDYMVAVGAAA